MKTSLIHLSPTADWRFAVARVRGGRQERVILVWRTDRLPVGQAIIRHNPRLVLRLMQRRSLRKGVPLAVVTTDAYLRAESAKLGLPLFANTRQARSADWGLSQLPSLPKPSHTDTSIKKLRAQATSRRAAIRP
jgi:hypothetical protein